MHATSGRALAQSVALAVAIAGLQLQSQRVPSHEVTFMEVSCHCLLLSIFFSFTACVFASSVLSCSTQNLVSK
ncbi:hypothetical protein PVAP13_9NG413614 [Panicum virgatum]|uniref:Uncharacterized protein n=1 Tax=Panicum virgatum TaxID=38727 RepID=A0A8T0MUY7_PANVG|nr:hypothetical protein PVAP13_9NG413614 [Panicum virgatum]